MGLEANGVGQIKPDVDKIYLCNPVGHRVL